jgi:hypothetical protein
LIFFAVLKLVNLRAKLVLVDSSLLNTYKVLLPTLLSQFFELLSLLVCDSMSPLGLKKTLDIFCRQVRHSCFDLVKTLVLEEFLSISRLFWESNHFELVFKFSDLRLALTD